MTHVHFVAILSSTYHNNLCYSSVVYSLASD